MKIILESVGDIEWFKRLFISKPKPTSLQEDIERDKLPQEINQVNITHNPFGKTKREYFKWEKEDEELIRNCALSNIPGTNTFTFLKSQFPKHLSSNALRTKLRRLGFRVKGDLIVKTDDL